LVDEHIKCVLDEIEPARLRHRARDVDHECERCVESLSGVVGSGLQSDAKQAQVTAVLCRRL
jgi:hypothetical protein